MGINDKISTGHPGFDEVIDRLRLGDNVVWQVDSPDDYRRMVQLYVAQAIRDQRRLIYVRFGSHEPLLAEDPAIQVVTLDSGKGFESFATEVHNLVKKAGKKAFYVFDCLTDLLTDWHSDLMIGNFFKVTCPYLYELDTVAYFAVVRDVTTFATIAGIRETTQLLLDLYQVHGKLYIHPLKVWQRYSPTMFFPHLIQGQEAICMTASSEVAELFGSIRRGVNRPDHWDIVFDKAREALTETKAEQQLVKRQLMSMLIGGQSRMFELCDRYFTLQDILTIASREVGTGFIGGKSIGMLVARKILEVEAGERFQSDLEPHDSFYVGADVFYTYIVQNGWWRLRTRQKTTEGYYQYAPELRVKLLTGRFPKDIQEQFVQLLEYFGQSPIIVRSSSLLEDNFGNAFAGKYESVFCANQGTPEERYEAFEQAIRDVYASMMNQDALDYRMNRGLVDQDEQMAILVQRVSGDQHGEFFFPHVAGVGNSSNLYVWDKSIDMSAGMLRLVFGLGTRAVDRTAGDYARIVCLDDPQRLPPTNASDLKKYSQHSADLISLKDNRLATLDLSELFTQDIKVDKALFASYDTETANWLRERGISGQPTPYLFDFRKLLTQTDFPAVMKEMLTLLERVYAYPVDIEFTANFTRDAHFKVNLLQCRPLQTRGLGQAVTIPDAGGTADCLFATSGNFMGGNTHLRFDSVIMVRPETYKALADRDKYSIARQIGQLNTRLKGQSVLLLGPGRWGTTTPSLGVPVHFSELSQMAVICEVSSPEAGFVPELSYGSHFFQDLVEAGIFYVALFAGQPEVIYQPEKILKRENHLLELLPQSKAWADVIHVAQADGIELFADIVSQRVLCR